MLIELTQLRKKIRKQRKQVSVLQQQYSEQHILNRLRHLPEFKHAKHIGIYLHAFGEIQTRKIIEYCFHQKKSVYLPMICNMNQRLVWVKISLHQFYNQRFSYHPFGMQEPMASRGQHVSHLDLLIMPLLACDAFGTRIGMGGGFYDKTLASAPYHRPFRLGLAHAFQLVPQTLIREPWDQPLDGLLMPQQFLRFNR
jgi:5-formyltetrahydrofolate cyclo-ligase